MNKRILLSLAVVLLASAPALSQDVPASTAADNPSIKAVSITGTVGGEGKTFVSDKDHRTWKVSNPAALLKSEGRHVKVKARLTPAGDDLFIISVKLAQEQSVAYNPSDSAFRR
jgi:hypothetical protein